MNKITTKLTYNNETILEEDINLHATTDWKKEQLIEYLTTEDRSISVQTGKKLNDLFDLKI